MKLRAVFSVTILSFGFASIIAIEAFAASSSGAPSCHELFQSGLSSSPVVASASPPKSRFADEDDSAISGLMAQLFKASGQDAVMDYFVAGIYLNALLIAKVHPAAVEAGILQRAREQLPDRKMFDQVLDIDEAIRGQTPLKKDTIVYRGQGSNVPPPKNGVTYEVGEILTFPQFLSTSPDRYLAEDYVKGIFLQINVPKGVQALNVQQFLGMRGGSYELLFARDTSLRILNVEQAPGDGFTTVTAEMIPPR